MDSKPDFDAVLRVYNSIEPSRIRWVRNCNEMRNRWPELFEVLERASGRSGIEASLFDENWHVIAADGGGPENKPVEPKVAEAKKKA